MAMEIAVVPDEKEKLMDNSLYLRGVAHLCGTGVARIPSKYVFPPSDRSAGDQGGAHSHQLGLPIVDLSDLHTPNRATVISLVGKACQEFGFFQVINHGIPKETIRDMTDACQRFFDLPFEERSRYMSADVRAPVRCGTSFNETKDKVFSWRDFLKLTCHPLPQMLPHWPSTPANLRDKVRPYAVHVRELFLELVAAILESLGLVSEEEVMKEFKDGTQLMAVNYYPPCPEPELTLGMPPHSDFGFLTLLHQDAVEGLQIQHEGSWLAVKPLEGSLVVNVGDHLEIVSNGKYRSILHRVVVNSRLPRMSVASIHSLAPSAVVRPAAPLIDAANPRRYIDTYFSDFVNYLSTREVKGKNFVQSRMVVGAQDEERA
ncbi:2-oxoglutarate (2OG) and Fe(II)-dependent oxygenase superfamily protein [Wolffia australiana]